MAKFLENDNESPEVDLKNLTVKLAGMGLDEEIEEVIREKTIRKIIRLRMKTIKVKQIRKSLKKKNLKRKMIPRMILLNRKK